MCIEALGVQDYTHTSIFTPGQVHDVSIGMTNDFGTELPEVYVKDNKGNVAQMYMSEYTRHFHQIGIEGAGYYHR